MHGLYRIITALLIMLYSISISSYGQTKVQGILIDSTYNNILRSVSVSVLEQGSTKIAQATLTDEYGKFVFEDLLPQKPYIVQFSHTGYKQISRQLQLKAKEHINLGYLHMPFQENELEAVEVFPPIRMNGDTLEFNADAFQLDSNAVVEDLLRQLPGLVVWGDGAVTYNGKEIPSILVNGKPFFGSDMNIALQNIQKQSVKTIQIYDNRDEQQKKSDPEDKKYEINVALKEGKENMYFGSVGAGLGNQGRYNSQINFNISDLKRQATLAYSGNNTNKTLQSINQLLKNTTFKGVGIHADYDADFLKNGIQKEQMLGARYQHDFLGSKQVGLRHLIHGELTSSWLNDINKVENTTQLLSETSNEENTRTFASNNESDNLVQKATLSYENTTKNLLGRPISINSNLFLQNTNRESTSGSEAQYQYSDRKSSNKIHNQENNETQSLNFNSKIDFNSKNSTNNGPIETSKQGLKDQITYSLDLHAQLYANGGAAIREGDYSDFDDPNNDKYTFRQYDTDFNSSLIGFNFSSTATQSGIQFNVNAKYFRSNTINQVMDKGTSGMQQNNSLTHHSTFNQQVYEPSINFNKTLYNRSLYGRSNTAIKLNTKISVKLYQDENSSTLDYRNLNLQYRSFLPQLGLSYNRFRNSLYHATLSVNYNYNEEYPYLDRIRPFYDDINPAYRNYGSAYKLQPTGVHELRWGATYGQIRQYGYQANLHFSYKNYVQGLSDSVVYAENQQQVYTVQMNNTMSIYSAVVDLKKPFLLGKNKSLTVDLLASINWGDKYQYLNGQLQDMRNNRQDLSINTYYTLNNKYQVGWKNSVGRYRRYNKIEQEITNDYTSYTWNSALSMSYALTRRWSVLTNGTRKYHQSGTFKDEVLIWNASISYRFLKGNNLECKVAAYDLLRQNKGTFFMNGVTEFTTGYRNILTQYYMVSVSYFPRKFGFK